MSKVGVELSNAINRMKDAIIERLDTLDAEDAARAMFGREHLLIVCDALRGLPSLRYRALVYRVIASVRGEIVYREGIDYLSDVSPDRLGDLAVAYLRHVEETRNLVRVLECLDIPERDRIISLLERGGVRAGMSLEG